jgi:dTMP kinase
LFLAARQEHLERVIRPAIAGGAWVLCDRFWDSTRVYQGLVGGLGLKAIDRLHEAWLEPFRPGLTLLLDLPAEAGLARARAGRFEAKGGAFHARVRQGFLQLATAEPARFTVIDATVEVDRVTEAATRALAAYRQRLGTTA